MIEFDAMDTSLSGGGMCPPGRYHAVVEDISPTDDGQQYIATMEMVAGDNQDVVGKKQKEYFGFGSAGANNRFLTFAIAVGLTTKDEWEKAKAAGVPLNIDETAAVMRSCIVEVKHEEYKGRNAEKAGKFYPQIGYRFFPLDDDRFKDVPRDGAFLPKNPAGGAPVIAAPAASGSATAESWAHY
jgi:hypothetical protein